MSANPEDAWTLNRDAAGSLDRFNALKLLRTPFPPNQISKLPKPYKRESPKGKCPECGGWHGLPAVHLDYVGHAALTDRLLDADPLWTWEPLGVNAEGLPRLDAAGGLWIRLTVCGVTRLGYGHAGEKHGGDAVKELIGDALRNAAMRFGAALDLWHKGQLHADEDEGEVKEEPQQKRVFPSVAASTLAAMTDGPEDEPLPIIDEVAKNLIDLVNSGGADDLIWKQFSRLESELQQMQIWNELAKFSAVRRKVRDVITKNQTRAKAPA